MSYLYQKKSYKKIILNTEDAIKSVGKAVSGTGNSEFSFANFNTISIKDYYIILQNNNIKQLNYYKKKYKAKNIFKRFNYNSKENENFLTINQLKKLIKSIYK